MFNYDEATGEFDYVAALAVGSASDLPEGMVSVEIPAAQYAVFTCTLPTLSVTCRQIHPWLAQSEYEHASTPEFESFEYQQLSRCKRDPRSIPSKVP